MQGVRHVNPMRPDKLLSSQLPGRGGLLFSLLIGLIALEAITVAALMGSQQFNTNQALQRHARSLLQDVVDETRENAQGFLGQAENAVLLTAGLFNADLLSMRNAAEMERYFYEQLAVVAQIDAIFFGDATGQFLFAKRNGDAAPGDFVTKFIVNDDAGGRRVYRVWRDQYFAERSRADDLEDIYDPRCRPWYALAEQKGKTVWTDPYIFFTSKRPGLTVAAPVTDADGKRLGVVGADIELNALSLFLAGQRIGATGAAFIMHHNGDVLAYPMPEQLSKPTLNDQLRLARINDLDRITAELGARLGAEYPDLSELEGSHFDTFTVGGERYLSAVVPFVQGDMGQWFMGVYAPEEEFAAAIRKGQRQSIILGAVIGVLILTVAGFLSLILMRPLRTLQRHAYQDSLTGLLNRRSFHQVAEDKLREARRDRRPLSAIMIDIDRFKTINDQYGHAVGDEVLVAVAGRIRIGLSDSDVLSRYGGEEFAIILPTTDRATSLAVAERLCELVAATTIHTSKGPMEVKISLGVAETDGTDQTVADLLNCADQGLMAAKRQGRNRVVAL